MEASAAPSLINRPVPCAHCGFDLRGTPAGGFCPECGLAVLAGREGGIWVDGKWLVVKSGAVLPRYCVKTDQPVTDPPRTRSLYWAHPLLVLLIFINVLVLLIVYLIVRKECRITYSVSAAGLKKYRRFAMVGGLLLAVAAITGISAGVASGRDDLAALLVGVTILAALAGIVLLVMSSHVLTISKHKDGQFWIKGCSAEFLDRIHRGTTTAMPTAPPTAPR